MNPDYVALQLSINLFWIIVLLRVGVVVVLTVNLILFLAQEQYQGRNAATMP